MTPTQGGAEEQAPGLSFPAAHVLIAMGPADDEFRASLIVALEVAGARMTQSPVQHRLSRSGRYQSLHIEVYVESRDELESLYAVVKAHPGVVFRL